MVETAVVLGGGGSGSECEDGVARRLRCCGGKRQKEKIKK